MFVEVGLKTLEKLLRTNSIMSPVTNPIFRLGFWVTVVLLVIGFSMEAFMLDKPSKNS